MKIVGNSKFQKAANGSLILNFLRKEGGASRSMISEKLGLQPSTVTYIMNRLLQAGLVCEAEPENNTENVKRGVKLEINSSYGAVIGLDLQADYYNAVISDITGRILETIHREYLSATSNFETRFSEVMAEVEKEVPNTIPVLGAGVAIPGVVDPEGPVIEECWTHNLRQKHLAAYLESEFSFPISVENDANCCAWGSLWYDSEEENDSFIYLLPRFHRRDLVPKDYPTIGIGLGLVYNGHIYNGFKHRAGEFRSFLFEQSGSVPGQISLTQEEMERIRQDKMVRRKLVVELFRTLILFMHITNPRAIYIGGDLSGDGELIEQVLLDELQEQWGQLHNGGVGLVVLSDADYDAAKGASAAMLNTLYSIPRIGERDQNVRVWNSLLTNLIEQ